MYKIYSFVYTIIQFEQKYDDRSKLNFSLFIKFYIFLYVYRELIFGIEKIGQDFNMLILPKACKSTSAIIGYDQFVQLLKMIA